MAQTPEAALKKKIKAYLDSEGCFWSSVQGGMYSKPGDPDIIACVPSKDGRGIYLGIEAKTPTGRQSEVQKLREVQIRKAQGIYIIARDLDDVKTAVEQLKQ